LRKIRWSAGGTEEIAGQERRALVIGLVDENHPLVEREDVEAGIEAAEMLVLDVEFDAAAFQNAGQEHQFSFIAGNKQFGHV